MTDKQKTIQDPGKEVKVLGTIQEGATDLFETEKRSKEELIQPPKHPGGLGTIS